MFLGLPNPVWAVLCIEFVERLGYYAVSFSLFTYCTVMLRTGPSAANAILNALYIVIPIAAFLASGVADSRLGRPCVLAAALAVYGGSLILLFLSACPFFYGDFPRHSRTLGKTLFAVALLGFGAGYGAMKVCTSPIMADCVMLHYRGTLSRSEEEGVEMEGEGEEDGTYRSREKEEAEESSGILDEKEEQEGARETVQEVHEGDDQVRALLRPKEDAKDVEGDEKIVAAASLAAYGTVSGDTVVLCSQVLSILEEALEQQTLTRLFVYAYWVANVGGLVGSFIAPLLRNLEPARLTVGDEEHTTGYYYSFLLAAASVCLGGAFLYRWYHLLLQNAPSPNYILVRVLVAAVGNRLQLWRGTKQLRDTTEDLPRDWLEYACAELYTTGSVLADDAVILTDREPPVQAEDAFSCTYVRRGHSLNCVTDRIWVEDCRATLRVCRAFVALPIYWLICNQFSTNLMYQAAALDLPSSIPEELLNNINTVTMLAVLAAWDRWFLPQLLSGRVPSACRRIVLGFAFMCASMLWCVALQCAITSRGSYDHGGTYSLYSGARRLSAGWLVMPYVLQGFASAFVDPTVMEVAYRDAPVRMKGTVMGLYWVASSASGFLGLLLSPIMKPENATGLFFSFAMLQLLVSVLFYVLNRHRA